MSLRLRQSRLGECDRGGLGCGAGAPAPGQRGGAPKNLRVEDAEADDDD